MKKKSMSLGLFIVVFVISLMALAQLANAAQPKKTTFQSPLPPPLSISIVDPYCGVNWCAFFGPSLTILHCSSNGGELRYYADGELRSISGNGPGCWKYTFTGLTVGYHYLTVEIRNPNGSAYATLRAYRPY